MAAAAFRRRARAGCCGAAPLHAVAGCLASEAAAVVVRGVRVQGGGEARCDAAEDDAGAAAETSDKACCDEAVRGGMCVHVVVALIRRRDTRSGAAALAKRGARRGRAGLRVGLVI